MPDPESVLDESMSRRRVLAIGGGAVLVSLGAAGGMVELARREVARRDAPPRAALATSGASTCWPCSGNLSTTVS